MTERLFQGGLVVMLVAALASAGGMRLGGPVVIGLVAVGGSIALLARCYYARLRKRARQLQPFRSPHSSSIPDQRSAA